MWADSFFWIMAACTRRSRFPAAFAASSSGAFRAERFTVFQFSICSSGRRQLQWRKVLYVHTEKKKKNHFHLSASVHSPLNPTFQEGIESRSRISQVPSWDLICGSMVATGEQGHSCRWHWTRVPFVLSTELSSGSRSLGTAMQIRNLPLRHEKSVF